MLSYKLYKSEGEKDKNLSVEQYLDMIKPYLRDLINDHKTTESGEWKIQLNMHVNFISSKDTGEARTINILSDNEEIMLGYETDDIIINFLKSFLNNYQKEEQVMRGTSNFVFESVELLDYKLHKIKLQRGGSYIKSPKWIRDKSATINPKNKRDSNCFQYAVSIALDHQDKGHDPQIISKIKPFIGKYNWRSRDFPSGPKDWKMFE